MPTKSLDFANPPKSPIGSVINSLCTEAHEMARSKGFYEDIEDLQDYLQVNDQPEKHAVAGTDFTLAQLAKIASEVGEAVSAIQHGEYLELHEELADICIRVFDLAGHLDVRLGDCIILKMYKNRNRPYKHGKVC